MQEKRQKILKNVLYEILEINWKNRKETHYFKGISLIAALQMKYLSAFRKWIPHGFIFLKAEILLYIQSHQISLCMYRIVSYFIPIGEVVLGKAVG